MAIAKWLFGDNPDFNFSDLIPGFKSNDGYNPLMDETSAGGYSPAPVTPMPNNSSDRVQREIDILDQLPTSASSDRSPGVSYVDASTNVGGSSQTAVISSGSIFDLHDNMIIA